jgi:hypothetical protein
MFASPKAFAYPREAKHPREMPLRPAALLPYSDESELRPVALRPTLSDGMPFSNERKRNLKKNHFLLVQNLCHRGPLKNGRLRLGFSEAR